MQLNIDDFALRHKQLDNPLLPLERVEAVDGDSYLVCNRFGVTANVSKRTLIKLELQYESVVWDELIQIEQRIRFLTECQGLPDAFGYLKGVGLVKPVEQNKAIPQDTPWIKIDCNHLVIERLSDSRISQLEHKITSLEEEHEFLTEALDFLC